MILNQKDGDSKVKPLIEFSDDPKEQSKIGLPINATRPLPSRSGRKIGVVSPNNSQHFYSLPSKVEKLDKSLHARALFDYWAFIELIKFKGGKKSFAGVHEEMAEFFTQTQLLNFDKRRRLGLVPRGHLKSTLGTVSYVLWRLYRNPNLRICVATATKDLALQFVREIKQYYEDEQLQDDVWNARPHHEGRLVPILDRAGYSRRNQKWDLGDYTEAEDKKVVWRSDALQVIRNEVYKEPSILAASPGSTITGMHFDLMILDDIINDETTATQEKINKTLRWTQDLESIIDPQRSVAMGYINNQPLPEVIGDELLVWGTRYAKGDYYEFLLENLEDFEYTLFFRNIYVNQVDSSDGFIWGDRFNEKTVQRLKKRQGIIRFSSQYLNKVVVSEDIIFDIDRFNYILPNHIDADTLGLGMARIKKPGSDQTVDVQLQLVIDPAISQKKTADNTVIMVGGIDHEYNLYICDFRSGKMLPDELIRSTYELADKWHLNAAWIEVVSFQQSLLYMFRSKFMEYRPLALREYRPKGDKKARIETHLQPIVFNHQLYLVSWMKSHTQLQEEFSYFPSPVTHDDHLDAMAMLVENAKPTPSRKGRRKAVYDHFTTNSRYGGRIR